MKNTLFVFVIVALGTTSQAAQIYIGTSEISITRDRPVAIEGAFRLRVAQEVSSPVTANVIALESRDSDKISEQSIMVSADLVHLPMELIHDVREAVAKLIPGLNSDNIYISTTHMHSAPVVMRGNFVIPDGVIRIEEYNQFCIERVSQAVVNACRSPKPGSVVWGLGHLHSAYNRRTAYLSDRASMYGPLNSPATKRGIISTLSRGVSIFRLG
ncbi:MAG: hypothetical protein P1U77_11720 [Rubripirellula sp.]|nr:hypothetical protein [Rubripirellula sp.]